MLRMYELYQRVGCNTRDVNTAAADVTVLKGPSVDNFKFDGVEIFIC